ncbi:MAG TPA: aldehyde dehydrogenase family protein [Ilumatobacteraceae bacterium]|nr:aldehyde dehydrogenase family protein [Ilumatobacteraceae bacterium]
MTDRTVSVSTPSGASGATPGAAAGSIAATIAAARAAFATGDTRSAEWRRSTLTRLRGLIVEREAQLLDALAEDVGKPRPEAWLSEIGFTLADIDHTLANLANWMAPERVATPLMFKPGVSTIHSQPLGVVAVIAPWNYPLQLAIVPMVAAIAAGNAVIVKPSEVTPASSAAVAALIAGLNDPAIGCVQGAIPETTELLAERFDHILYTGNGKVARIVMAAAAKHLTPVTLELGGKSPAIVSRNAKIDTAARRLAWGKFLNAGQTCIAPDYVLVEEQVHDQLVDALAKQIGEFYGSDPKASPDYARIVDDRHFARLTALLDNGTVAIGGQADAGSRYIAPTVLTDVSVDDPVMAEEIFGPILPIIKVRSLDAAVQIVNAGDKPLALYTFSENDADNRHVLDATSSGGACVNGTLMHISNPNLPFGGVGESGMGAYHGKAGFDTFSHHRSVFERSTRIDPPMTYPPYTDKNEKLIRTGLAMPDPRDLAAKVRGKFRRG